MKLLCECGHPNLLHFAGTGRCHHVTETQTTVRIAGNELEATKQVRCDCERFVLPAPELERTDLE